MFQSPSYHPSSPWTAPIPTSNRSRQQSSTLSAGTSPIYVTPLTALPAEPAKPATFSAVQWLQAIVQRFQPQPVVAPSQSAAKPTAVMPAATNTLFQPPTTSSSVASQQALDALYSDRDPTRLLEETETTRTHAVAGGSIPPHPAAGRYMGIAHAPVSADSLDPHTAQWLRHRDALHSSLNRLINQTSSHQN